MSRRSMAGGGVTRREVVVAGVAASTGLLLPTSLRGSVGTARSVETGKIDVTRFVEDCIAANGESEPQAAVLEVLARAVASPGAALAALGEPTEAGMRVLHRSRTLTIFCATWTPQMNLMPHNHLMWANIGIFTGREDNILWRETADGLKAFGVEALFAGDATALSSSVIHSVTNPLPRFTGGIHIYGGDFFDTTRSQWNPETLDKEPSNGAVIRAIFDRENEKLRRNK
ncbi:MAG: hypothetical protein MUC56_18195 [Thermoanaerobaculales bacterium]|nr:hypothetical protein [Thermoanaerobaculales bacterium]